LLRDTSFSEFTEQKGAKKMANTFYMLLKRISFSRLKISKTPERKMLKKPSHLYHMKASIVQLEALEL
jgi:hypothetical protein